MKNIFLILQFFIVTNLLAQESTSIKKVDLLQVYIDKLSQKEDIISNEFLCNQKEEVKIEKEYKQNLKKVIAALQLAKEFYETPLTINDDKVLSKEEFSFVYQSEIKDINIKRKIKQSATPSRSFNEEFTLQNNRITINYKVIETGVKLAFLTIKYPDKTEIYFDFYQGHYSIKYYYKEDSESIYNDYLKLKVFFSADEITGITIYYNDNERYRLYRKQDYYTKHYTDKYFCLNEKEDYIDRSITGNLQEIKPSTYLLWYKGFIGKYPIKMMLKRGFNKETNDERILDMAYGYDSKKKWMYPQNLWELQEGIYGHEKNDDSPEWSVNFEYNQVLKGDWDNQNGTILPISLTPMTKEFPQFSFKAQIEEELTPTGKLQNNIVRGITIYKNDKKIQEIKNEDGATLDYYELGYVDINYDGYLDLFINDKLYLYNTATQKFIINNEDDYYRYLAELGQYNLFNKSFTSQMNRTMLEFRAVNGKLTPYHSSSYYPNGDGDIVMLEEKYVNGKWKTIEERIEKMDYEEEPVDDNIDIASPENYALNIDLTVSDGSLLFSPDFYNNTGQKLTFKQSAKLFTEVTDANNKTHRQFLYNLELTGEKGIDYLDDSYITFNGKICFYKSTSHLIPFFPLNLTNGDYTFQLVLEHPLFGKVTSKSQSIHLPFQLKKDTAIEHFVGSINDKVHGTIYFKVNDKKVIGTFINAKTGKNIKLKGQYTRGVFGVDTVNFEEYEKNDELSGYFEGTITNLKGENKGVYKGYWISPDRKARVPFKFKKQ